MLSFASVSWGLRRQGFLRANGCLEITFWQHSQEQPRSSRLWISTFMLAVETGCLTRAIGYHPTKFFKPVQGGLEETQ